MSTDELSLELSALRGLFKIAATVVSGLLIVAIGGWITIQISDHYEMKNLKPKVESLWELHHPTTNTAKS